MSISSETRKAGPYDGNDSTTDFAFAFKVFQASDLRVITTTAGVETVQALTTNYTVSLNADQNTYPGGTVTMLSAPATGSTLTITSDVPNTQPVNLVNLGGFYPSVINDALDRATIQIQQLEETVTTLETGGVSSPWTVSGANVYRSSGSVGIGTSTPSVSYPLDVVGSIRSSSVVYGAALSSSGNVTAGSTGQAGIYMFVNADQVTQINSGSASPQGSISAYPGSLYLQNVDANAATSISTGNLWIKTLGIGNTGWTEANSGGGSVISVLNDLTDVNAPSPGDGQVLSWSASTSAWVAATVGSGGSGATELNGLSDVTITSPSSAGDMLIYNGTSSQYENRALAATDVASGTFADARISSSSVTQHLPTVTLAGDASGSIDLSAATTLTVSVVDDSHNHIIGNVDGLQTALDAKAALAGATFTGAVVGTTIRAKPLHTSQSTAYTLTATDMNTTINTTGNVTIDGSVGTAGDIVIVCNNSASPISIVDGTITTMRLAGTTTTGTRTLAARGLAFIYYVSATEVSVGGSGVT